jgi:threonine synthase
VARLEGIFCEPSSAASIAGVRKLAGAGEVPDGATVVCVLTGNGLKDPDTAGTIGGSIIEAASNADDVRRTLRWAR